MLKTCGSMACVFCDKTFERNSKLFWHLPVHTKERPYFCKHCGKECSQQSGCRIHELTHSSQQFKCDKCPQSYKTEIAIKNHAKVHLSKQFKCERCDKVFGGRHDLYRHIRIVHDNIKPHECSVCEKKFGQINHLTRHMRIHTGETPYCCSVCNKSFSTGSGLRSHSIVHVDDQLKNGLKCSVCGKSFNCIRYLRAHLRTHSKGNFECDICQKVFMQRKYLTKHMKFHTAEKIYKCRMCHKAFADTGTRGNHEKTHGEKEHKCHVCPAKFRQAVHLRRHKKCLHEKERPFGCLFCSYTATEKFKLARHVGKHLNEHPYICSSCGVEYRGRATLKQHVRNCPPYRNTD